MATFDSNVQIGYGTDFTPDAGKKQQIAEDGTITILNFYGQTIWTGKIVMPTATQAEKDYVDSFYAANANLLWNFVHPGDGKTYTLLFSNEPKVTRLETFLDVRYLIEIDCVGTR
jgi:hypothetical protein